MQRDAARLTQDSYDVLVIGGGIHGLFAAYDAAADGLTQAMNRWNRYVLDQVEP